jgi:hypothetical protein
MRQAADGGMTVIAPPKRDGFIRVGYAVISAALLRLGRLALALGFLDLADTLCSLARATHGRAFPGARR